MLDYHLGTEPKIGVPKISRLNFKEYFQGRFDWIFLDTPVSDKNKVNYVYPVHIIILNKMII